MEPAFRRPKGTIPLLVVSYLEADATPKQALTPYFIAKMLGLSPGSVTAACKSLVREGKIKYYGDSPFMVGRKTGR